MKTKELIEILTPLIAMAKDGIKLYEQNAAHSEFVKEDKIEVQKAECFLIELLKQDKEFSAEEILDKWQSKDNSLPNWIPMKLALKAMEEYASQHKEQPEIEVFRWLLGYTDFRGREEGEGAYWWRKELRERLKCININIKQK